MRPIDIASADLEIVRCILSKLAPELEVRAFGSRVSWTARATSDLDLALMTDKPLSIARMAGLKAAFTKSDLPFRVDIVDWASTSEDFREMIEKNYVVLATRSSESFDERHSGVVGEWREVTLGEIAEVVGGSTPSTKVLDNFDGDIPWLTPKDLTGTHDRYISRGARNLSRRGLIVAPRSCFHTERYCALDSRSGWLCSSHCEEPDSDTPTKASEASS